MVVEDNEAEVFGVELLNQAAEIGSVYIFLDSLASLLPTKGDEAPIINSTGDQCGSLTYSIVPTATEDDGTPMNLTFVEGVNDMLSKTIQVQVQIKEAKGLPPKFSTDIQACYKWIDEESSVFETQVIPLAKNNGVDFGYKTDHNLYISSHVAETMPEAILKIDLTGKRSQRMIERLNNDHKVAMLEEMNDIGIDDDGNMNKKLEQMKKEME